MTFVQGYKARIVGGSLLLSAYITDWSESSNVDMLDVTVPVNASVPAGQAPPKVYIPGMTMSTFTMKGFLDVDGSANGQFDQVKTWFESATTDAVTFGPSGLAFGSEVVLTYGLVTKSEIGGAVTTPVTFGLDCQNSGKVPRGASLHDLTAETADGSSSAYDGGAASTTGAIAHLHTTAFSGLTSNAVIIEDSATGSSGWATIGTFATATALSQERITIAGNVRRYVRATWDVTGTGTTSFSVGFART